MPFDDPYLIASELTPDAGQPFHIGSVTRIPPALQMSAEFSQHASERVIRRGNLLFNPGIGRASMI